ncbi:MAG: glycosyltransferase [Candidatus Babeliales bacterium]
MKKNYIFLFLFFFVTNAEQSKLISINFDISMNGPISYGFNDPQDYLWLTFWRSLYEKYNLSIMPPLSELRIPKLIHQIWLGSEFPEEYREWQASWLQIHPDWQYKLWTDEDVKMLKLYNQNLFDNAVNYAQQSDILRYEILYRFGGLYIDIDFRCLKPFDVLHHCYDFYIGIMSTGTVDLGIGLIGSKPHSPILKEVIKSMCAKKIKSYQDILSATGNLHFMKAFMRSASQCKEPIITFPASFFYPSPNKARFLTKDQQDQYIRPESFAIHYWACSWQKKEALCS